ncbi:MAG: DNA methylase [Candidatus Kentron sp. G]|nr:MAG: DNA methylase [Candidatus Kentron sp. G]VFM98198.1 MAG: DNA methylase [Candidatus Kentron sp. G]VFN00168.1 MAG: DNA methylase [Candidatus Kentron sp. G]
MSSSSISPPPNTSPDNHPPIPTKATAKTIAVRSTYWQHEPCWYAVRRGRTGHWSGDRKQSTLWSLSHSKNDTGHGTQKPVEAMRRPMENNASPGQAVYEPFSGSGTSLIAAQTCGRVCLALEIDPLYVDMAVRRWEAFAGDKAMLEGAGKTFEEIAREREGAGNASR